MKTIEIAILTEEIANELIRRGFELKGQKKGEYAEVWYFEDCAEIEEIIASLQDAIN